jgi:hypothetical protein
MAKKIVEIFDLDGTLTEDFSTVVGDKTGLGLKTYSLWNLITRELVADQKKFDIAATEWKQYVTQTPNVDKISSSKTMTEIGASFFPVKHRNSRILQKKATEITNLFYKKGIINLDAIAYLKDRLEQEICCVISTASYKDGAIGFVNSLVNYNLLPKVLAQKILISGTELNWENLTVTHMNVDQNKIVDLERLLKKHYQNNKYEIQAVFGDDPEINDRSLLAIGKYSFVIKTEKNSAASLPDNCVFADWPTILKNKNKIDTLHNMLLTPRTNL